MDTTNQHQYGSADDSVVTSKCLLCLEPSLTEQPTDCLTLVLSFVDMATDSETKNLWHLPKKLIKQGMTEGSYCNKCYNQLHELHFLQKKITSLQEFLIKLETDIQTGILETYSKHGDSPDEADSKKVAELRQQFYKLSLKNLTFDRREETEEFESGHFDDDGYPDLSQADEGEFVECNVCVEEEDGPHKPTASTSKRPPRTKRKPKKLLGIGLPSTRDRKLNLKLRSKRTVRKSSVSPEQDKLKQRAIVKLERLDGPQKSDRKRKSPKFRNTSHLGRGRSFHSKPKIVRSTSPSSKPKKAPKQSFDCDYCGEGFPDRTQRRLHANEVHQDEKTQICTSANCEATFFTKTELKKHLRKHEAQLSSIRCPVCQKRLPTQLVLQAHLMSHTNEEKVPHYKCSICGKKYNNLQLLNAHVRYIHELRERFVCRVCGKTFGTESYLAAHEVSHDSIGHHLCELCGKSYKHKKDLRLHDLKIHSIGINLKTHICTICDRGFYRADHLRIHQVKENHYEAGQPVEIPIRESNEDTDTMLLEEFKCTICGREFVSDLAMRTHLLTHAEVDSSVPLHACPECDRRYQNAKSLEYHIKYMHKLKAMHKCNLCEKTFGRLSSLKRHESIHDVNSSYHCTECEKVYKNKIDVRNHFKREHLGETSFEYNCAQCNKKFYRKDMLRLHQVKAGHYAPGSLDSKSTSTQIIVVEASEVPPMSAKLEVIGEDEEIELGPETDELMENVTEDTEQDLVEHELGTHEIEIQELVVEDMDDQEYVTEEVETQELETQEVEAEQIETQEIMDEGVLDSDLHIFIESMN